MKRLKEMIEILKSVIIEKDKRIKSQDETIEILKKLIVKF